MPSFRNRHRIDQQHGHRCAPTGITDPVPANNTARDTDTVDQALSSISGYVYLDRNDNGVRESGDQGIKDVEVSLSGTDLLQNNVDRQTTTNTDGGTDLAICCPEPMRLSRRSRHFSPTARRHRVPARLNDPTVTDNLFANVQIGRGQDAVNFNFGELRPSLSKRDLIASAFRTDRS